MSNDERPAAVAPEGIMKRRTVTATLLAASLAAAAQAQTAPPAGRYTVPATVSPEARAGLEPLYARLSRRPTLTRPSSADEWARRNAEAEAVLRPVVKATADRLSVQTSDDRLGGVPVVRIRPRGWRPNGRTLVYLHGGGYVLFSAASTLAVPALVASATGNEVISVDYTLAPRGTWRTATDQVLSVWSALLQSGASAHAMGLFGDSAGGGLAAGSVLKMRDEGLALPGALYLLSPWADITNRGDTASTLAGADPILDTDSLGWGADVYAAPADQLNPYVSPVDGDYRPAFPPTLIQVGTREIFLSNAVRQYQAIRDGGHEAVLDVYEGMPHVFQTLIPFAPETRTAIRRAAEFFDSHLTSAKGGLKP